MHAALYERKWYPRNTYVYIESAHVQSLVQTSGSEMLVLGCSRIDGDSKAATLHETLGKFLPFHPFIPHKKSREGSPGIKFSRSLSFRSLILSTSLSYVTGENVGGQLTRLFIKVTIKMLLFSH